MRLRFGPILLPRLLTIGALLLGRLEAIRPLLRPILQPITALLVEIFPVVHPVFPGVFAVIVIVVPGVVVHVAAAVKSVWTVVVVVVHAGTNRDAGGEADQAGRNRHVGVVVLFDNHRGVRRSLRVDDFGVVLRHVHDLRIGGLDDDDFLTG